MVPLTIWYGAPTIWYGASQNLIWYPSQFGMVPLTIWYDVAPQILL